MQLSIEPVFLVAPENALTIPWVPVGNDDWLGSVPLFNLYEQTTEQDFNSLVHIACDAEAIHLILGVYPLSETLASCTAIQIGMDAWGDGFLDPPGPDDALLVFARTAEGARGWATRHGRKGGAGGLERLRPLIARDAKTGCVQFELSLPWREFQSAVGAFPAFGLRLPLHCSRDVSDPVTAFLPDPDATLGEPPPLQLLAPGDPPLETDRAEIVALKPWVSDESNTATFRAVVCSARAGRIVVRSGAELIIQEFPTAESPAPRRFDVTCSGVAKAETPLPVDATIELDGALPQPTHVFCIEARSETDA